MDNLTITDYVEIAGIVVALASAVAAVTPTDSDNRIVGAIIRALDAFALNWNKRNPRKVAAAEPASVDTYRTRSERDREARNDD